MNMTLSGLASAGQIVVDQFADVPDGWVVDRVVFSTGSAGAAGNVGVGLAWCASGLNGTGVDAHLAFASGERLVRFRDDDAGLGVSPSDGLAFVRAPAGGTSTFELGVGESVRGKRLTVCVSAVVQCTWLASMILRRES